MRCSHLLAIVVAGSCAFARVADAQEPDAAKVRAAAEEFDAGRRAFQQKDFSSAAAHFENAFRDVPSDTALRLAIRSHKGAKNPARSATLAQLALDHYPDDEGTVTLANQVLGELESSLHKVTVSCEPACSLVADNRAAFDEPAESRVVYLEPGSHSVAATWSENRSRRSDLDAEAGGESELSFEAPEIEKAPVSGPATASGSVGAGGSEPGAEPKGGLPPIVTYAGIGLTAVLGGVTIWSGVDTKNNPGREAVETQCVDQGESCPVYQDALDRQRRTNILLGTTIGVAAVTGVVALFFTDWGPGSASSEESDASGRASIQPVVSLHQGVQLGALGRF